MDSDKYYYIKDDFVVFRFDNDDNDLDVLDKIIRNFEEKYINDPLHRIIIRFELKEENDELIFNLMNIQNDNRYIELFDKSTKLHIGTVLAFNIYKNQ
jgi:hypothetical protein